MNLEDLVGLQTMIGVSNSEVTPDLIRLFRDTHAGGLIVFRRNFKTAAGFKSFLSGLENVLQKKLLVAVDHEGGRVIHLAEGITVFPDNLALGRTSNEDFARRQGEIEAGELRRLGIDLNLAPTLDVLTAKFSPNIGIRSYGPDAELVARLGTARIKAMQAGGLSACAKHFPGQGQSPLDAHLDLPVLATTWEEMEKIHLKPFRSAIEAGVDTVMTSHPIYPELDRAKVPATFSKKIVRELLRSRLGFQGTILSDDLEMGALKNLCSIGESACRAVEAGHDMVLVCKSADAQKEVFRDLLAAYEKKRLNLENLKESSTRILKLINKRKSCFADTNPAAHPEGKALAREIARKGIEISLCHCEPEGRSNPAFKNEIASSALRPPRNDGQKTLVIFPQISSLGGQIFIENEFRDEKKFLQDYLTRQGIEDSEIAVVKISPEDHEISALESRAKKADTTVFFCYDAHLFPKTRELLEKIQLTAKRCVVILLRDPYDKEWVRPDVACVNAFGFRSVQIEAALDRLFQEHTTRHSEAEGRRISLDPSLSKAAL
ncbi:MAG: beta-N-acetylhexosaminidase [Candidatus Omnitrophica bacterium]|nr:beta-N-acetylhexosaminidase [Candidatus Omnitrophota bacterium]